MDGRVSHLLDDPIGYVVFVELDQGVHEASGIHQELFFRRFPEIVHLWVRWLSNTRLI